MLKKCFKTAFLVFQSCKFSFTGEGGRIKVVSNHPESECDWTLKTSNFSKQIILNLKVKYKSNDRALLWFLIQGTCIWRWLQHKFSWNQNWFQKGIKTFLIKIKSLFFYLREEFWTNFVWQIFQRRK